MRGPLNSALDFVDDGASFRVRRLARRAWRRRRYGGEAQERWRDLPLYAKLAALAVWTWMAAILIPVAIVGCSMIFERMFQTF